MSYTARVGSEAQNIIFYFWLGEMNLAVKKVPHILEEVIVGYNPIMKFKVSINHVYM